MPKSVDWLDVYAEVGPDAVRAAFEAAAPAPGMPARDDGVLAERPDKVLPPDDLRASRLFLEECFAPPEHARAGSCLELVQLDGRFHRFDGARYVDIGPAQAVRGECRRWSASYWTRKLKKTETRPQTPEEWAAVSSYVPANLSRNKIESIVVAAADEVQVMRGDVFEEQFWIEPVYSRAGTARWERPAWERRVRDPRAAGLPDPAGIIPLPVGLLDTGAWMRDGELRVLPHTPRFFNANIIDVELPVDEVRAVLEGGLGDLVTYADDLCPLYSEVLEQIFHREHDPDAAAENIREFHKVGGYWLTTDRSHHNANIAIWHGPSGAGKSTLLAVEQNLIGEANFVSTTFEKMLDGPHMASWIGKRVAFMPDGDLGRGTDKRKVLEIAAMISGRDAVSVRKMYQDEIPNIVLPTAQCWVLNQMPALQDEAGKLLRRLIVFDFQNVVKDPDRNLVEGEGKLLTPRAKTAQLLHRLVGLRHLAADGGFVQPKSSVMPLEDLKRVSNDYPDFLADWLVISNDPQDWVSCRDIYRGFGMHLKALGRTYEPPSDATFFTRLLPWLQGQGWSRREDRYRDPDARHAGDWGHRGLKLTRYASQQLSDGGYVGDVGELPGIG